MSSEDVASVVVEVLVRTLSGRTAFQGSLLGNQICADVMELVAEGNENLPVLFQAKKPRLFPELFRMFLIRKQIRCTLV